MPSRSHLTDSPDVSHAEEPTQLDHIDHVVDTEQSRINANDATGDIDVADDATDKLADIEVVEMTVLETEQDCEADGVHDIV